MTDKWDNTPPRNLIILACAVGSALLLISFKFGFDSYFDGMMREVTAENQERYDDLEAMHEAHAAWDARLERGGRMSIDEAMSQLGSRGRAGFPEIRPQVTGEMNEAPLEGWNRLPQEVVHPPTPQRAEAASGGAIPRTVINPAALRALEEAIRTGGRR